MKKYVLENHGEYVESFDKTYCSHTFLSSCAMQFDTYQQAYYAAKKVNKYYGYKRYSVSTLEW